MKLLLHICCGPCSIYPVKVLRERGYDLTGRWYNPNIHPWKEYRRRLDTLETYAEKISLPLLVERDYGLTEYLRKVVFHENARCAVCYEMRLEDTARLAAELGFPTFTTTLFYSKYQNHTLMQDIGSKMAAKYGVEMLYEDFSIGWQEGIDRSIEEGMYRQPYCGCIYSEQERYDNRWKKRRKKEFKRQQGLKNALNDSDSNDKQRQVT
ncbi:epoxyqueuosine reductase QueH [Desulforhopalus vacuolatus]|uniref:epoxyqueuosine reductase QueH n=1 Tax=Desulforhopalus vacuolatus TaxID=40414 RepID=UPI0019625C09|nr:epoxyqueuosine reductase QueH [Desulforhopalus vacuolatus]MBM9519429.1 epoxyqueuosine reductase QueH [Desulforhopalus vacuolatus]